MATLAPYGLRYPVDTDPADGPQAFLNLCTDITTNFNNRSRGIVAWHRRTTTSTTITTTESAVVRLDASLPSSRTFCVTFDAWLSSTAAAVAEVKIRYTTDGTAPNMASPVLRKAFCEISNTAQAQNVIVRTVSTTSTSATLRLLVTLVRVSGAQPIQLAGAADLPCVLTVEDVGPLLSPSGLDVEGSDPPPPDPGGGGGTFETPGQALNIGTQDGQNHFNVGIGRPSAHTDYSPSEIEGGYTSDPEFKVSDDGTAVQFRVRCDAARTSANTKYPRCELREYDEAGADRAAWNGASGTHYMQGISRVTHLPPIKPWVVVCQVHDSESDLVRVQTEGTSTSNLKLVARNTPPGGGSEEVVTIQSSYTLGDDIKWKLEVIDGNGTIYINGVAVRTFPASTSGCYFKAGCYIQTNTSDIGEDPAEYGAVELRELQHWHTGWPAPDPVPGSGGGGGTPTGMFGGAGNIATSQAGGPITPQFPQGTVAGDYLITQVHSRYGETIATPSGWELLGTRLGTDSTFAGATYLFGRFWQSGDAPPSYQTISGDGGMAAVCSRWVGVNAVTPHTTATAAHSASLPIVAPAVTTSVANTTVLYFATLDNDYTISSPSGGATLAYARATQPNGSDGMALALAYEQIGLPGSSGTCQMTATGSGNPTRWVAISIGLQPT